MTLIAESSSVAKDETPIQIVGNEDRDIIFTGTRSAVVRGSGRRLTFSGTGTVTVQGSLQSLQNDGTGSVKVNGGVTDEVRQTGRGSIVITRNIMGSIYNSGGGSITGNSGTRRTVTVNNYNGSVKISSFFGLIVMSMSYYPV